MITIQAEDRDAVLRQLANPRRTRRIRPPSDAAQALLELAEVIDVLGLSWRRRRPALPHVPACRHRAYHLTCHEFEMLDQESGGFCDICGHDADASGLTLHIDHDHAIGFRAVRGMLCPSCNVQLGNVDAALRAPTRAERNYLADPWHDRVGLGSLVCAPECGYAVHRTGWAA